MPRSKHETNSDSEVESDESDYSSDDSDQYESESDYSDYSSEYSESESESEESYSESDYSDEDEEDEEDESDYETETDESQPVTPVDKCCQTETKKKDLSPVIEEKNENELGQEEKEEKEEGKKEKRKKCRSGYDIFCSEQRLLIKKEHSDWKFAQVSKELGLRWKSLSCDEKNKYINQAKNSEK